MSSSKSLKKNFIMNALLTLSGIIFPFITFPYVSRILGPTGTGKIDFATSIISYFALFAQLGIPSYGVRECARVRDDKIQLSKTVNELITINLFMTLLAYIAFIPTLILVPKFSSEKALFIIISTTMIFNSIGIEYLYRALEQYTYITIRSVIFKFIALVSMFLLIRHESDYIVYGAISILAASGSNVFNFIHSRKHLCRLPKNTKYDYRRHIKPVLVFFSMACAVSIYANLDKSMLGFMSTETEVGYYGAATKIKGILVALITSLGTVIAPRAAYCIKQGNFSEFERISSKALRFVFFASVPVIVFFLFFAEDCIVVVSGNEYLPAVSAMKILLPTILFIGITGLVGMQTFVPLEKEKYVLYSEIGGAITNLLLNSLLIPRLHTVGASIGTLCAEFVVLMIQLYFLFTLRKTTKLIYVFAHLSIWKILVSCLLALSGSIPLLLFDFNVFRNETTNILIRLMIATVLFFAIYFASMLLFKNEICLELVDSVKRKFPNK